jgi:hypothetical protein
MSPCPLCNSSVPVGMPTTTYECDKCGIFTIYEDSLLATLTEAEKEVLSSAVRSVWDMRRVEATFRPAHARPVLIDDRLIHGALKNQGNTSSGR